jgi:fatty acid desaturase
MFDKSPVRDRKRWKPETVVAAAEVIRAGYDNWHWLLSLMNVYLRIACSIGIPYVVGASELYWWLAYMFISVPTIACWQRGLAEILHQSSHRTLAKNRLVNYIAGTFLAGYQVLQSFYRYRTTHIRHHVHLKNPKRDEDFKFQIQRGAYESMSRKVFLMRFILPCLVPIRPHKIRDLIVNRLFMKPTTWLEAAEMALSISSFAAVGLIAGWFGFAAEWALFWIVPLMTYFRLFEVL